MTKDLDAPDDCRVCAMGEGPCHEDARCPFLNLEPALADLDLDALDRLQVAIRECLSSHIGFEDTPGGKYAFTTLRLAGEQIPVLVAALRGAVEERERHLAEGDMTKDLAQLTAEIVRLRELVLALIHEEGSRTSVWQEYRQVMMDAGRSDEL